MYVFMFSSLSFTKYYGATKNSIFFSFNRKTSDVPENYREEGELVVPSYGYFIRGAQTTFSGVLRFVTQKTSSLIGRFYQHRGESYIYKIIHENFCILFQRPTMEVHPVQNDRLWLWIWKCIDCKQLFQFINLFPKNIFTQHIIWKRYTRIIVIILYFCDWNKQKCVIYAWFMFLSQNPTKSHKHRGSAEHFNQESEQNKSK